MCRCAMVFVGAENAYRKRFTTPANGGFSLFTVFAGGRREYKTRLGDTVWPTFCGFFSFPVLSFLEHLEEVARLLLPVFVLKRRYRKKHLMGLGLLAPVRGV